MWKEGDMSREGGIERRLDSYHNVSKPNAFESTMIEGRLLTTPWIWKSTAYQRTKENGLCERGVIPDYYGTITKIQPTLWPSLHMFLEDRLLPNAILIEYIPRIILLVSAKVSTTFTRQGFSMAMPNREI